MRNGMKWDVATAKRRGEQAVALAREDQKEMEARGITAAEIDRQDGTLVDLRDREAAHHARRTRMKELTAIRDGALGESMAFIGDQRFVVRRGASDNDLRLAVGVGQKVQATVVSVLSGLDLTIAAHGKYSERLARMGFVQADADRAVALRASLAGADRTQDDGQVLLKSATERRNALLREAIAGVYRIVTVARLALADRPERRRLYLDLIRGTNGRRRAVAETPVTPPVTPPVDDGTKPGE